MLHSYAFSNFQSFLDRVEVPLTLTDKDAVNGWATESRISRQRLTTALGVLGPNASGKTSLIRPLALLGWFLKHSFAALPDTRLPVVPHFNGGDKPTTFEVVADADEPDTLWRYKLSVNPAHIISESLERRVRRGAWYPIFQRKLESAGKYRVTQDGFGLDQAQAENVRANVSLIAWAAQFGVPLARRLQSFNLKTNVRASGRVWVLRNDTMDRVTRSYAENVSMSLRMRELLSRWDLGLSDIQIREREVEEPSADSTTQKKWLAYGVHRDQSGREHTLPFQNESSGTQSAFVILEPVLSVLEYGGVMAYDELDSDLHPHIVASLLDLFSSPETNPKQAQLVFTFHMVEVLRLLQKSQVMLVEKDGIESHAWRLDSVEGVRTDENRVAKYLAGAYGAVPRL